MKKIFLQYELALIAKEKGFNEECLGCYHIDNGKHIMMYHDCSPNSETRLKAPIHEQIQDWFVEKHGFNIWVDCSPKKEWIWTINIIEKGYYHQSDDEDMGGKSFSSKQEALINGIENAFKLI